MSTDRVYHSLYNSPSKQHITFGTSKRQFLVSKAQPPGYVMLPSSLSSKGFRFSKGSRIVFTDPTKDNPPIGTYESTMASSRTTCFEKQPEKDTRVVKSNLPGPGSYNIASDIAASPKRFSMTGRPKHREIEKSPGPSEYNVPDSINKLGLYVNSRVSSKAVKNLNFTGNRFPNVISEVPGPGAYSDSTSFSPTGTFYVSPFTSSASRRFNKARRKSFVSNRDIPGPGTYSNFSDFGDYAIGHTLTDRTKTARTNSMHGGSVSTGKFRAL